MTSAETPKNTAKTAVPPLVETAWLAEHLSDGDVRVIDASFYLPMMKRDAQQEHLAAHIPGAVFFDIDEIADDASGLPHMLPSAEKFSSRVRALGIGDAHHVVVYDGGAMASMRVWWMFRLFGHDRVSVLNGGLPKWKAENRPLESGRPAHPRAHFTARPRPELVRSCEAVMGNIESGAEQVIDARSAPRFAGAEAEPRPTQQTGHIPGSLNVPFNGIYDAERGGVVRSAAELKKFFSDAGVDIQRATVASCGSGVSACVLAFGLYLTGNENVAVYDGSWAEWGNREDVPVEK